MDRRSFGKIVLAALGLGWLVRRMPHTERYCSMFVKPIEQVMLPTTWTAEPVEKGWWRIQGPVDAISDIRWHRRPSPTIFGTQVA